LLVVGCWLLVVSLSQSWMFPPFIRVPPSL
jgi:hypothetical protein